MAVKKVNQIHISISELPEGTSGSVNADFTVVDLGASGRVSLSLDSAVIDPVITAAKAALKAKLEEGGHTTEGI